MSYDIKSIYRLYDKYEACLELRPHPDFPDSFQLHTPDKISKQHIGEVDILIVDKEMLQRLNEMITKCLNEL